MTPSPSSFVQPQTPEDEEEESYPTARALFDFTPSSEFELGVHGEFLPLLMLYRVKLVFCRGGGSPGCRAGRWLWLGEGIECSGKEWACSSVVYRE